MTEVAPRQLQVDREGAALHYPTKFEWFNPLPVRVAYGTKNCGKLNMGRSTSALFRFDTWRARAAMTSCSTPLLWNELDLVICTYNSRSLSPSGSQRIPCDNSVWAKYIEGQSLTWTGGRPHCSSEHMIRTKERVGRIGFFASMFLQIIFFGTKRCISPPVRFQQTLQIVQDCFRRR